MNLSFHIARRYLFAQKKQNAINIIALISVLGVIIGTMALVIVISVFNGFDGLIKSLYNSFNPDLLVTIKEGKSFIVDSGKSEKIKNTAGVIDFATVIEDKALLSYDEKQTIGVIKGVSSNYPAITGIKKMMWEGEFALYENKEFRGVFGLGISYFLNINLNVRFNYRPPVCIYVPKRTGSHQQALNRRYIYPSGIFAVDQEYDSKYVIVPIEFARDLFEYKNEVTSVEIKIKDNADINQIKKSVTAIFGTNFIVKNKYEQNELFYKTMQSEKWAIVLILSFILLIASFNIIGSLTMLILEKKSDIAILRSMGASTRLIKRIFLFEGWLISIIGALTGTYLGLIVCWVQQKFGLVKLQGSGSFIIDSYPVKIQVPDVLLVLTIVFIIGLIISWYPVHYISRRFLTIENEGTL